MKCPHCGMNIRDNIVECGYCGGTIARRPEKTAAGADRRTASAGGVSQKGASRQQKPPEEPGMEEEEDEEGGGLSAILQPGEHVLIGSLNVSVKKFFFHAYLTNKRIFLIDTQEKKLKVTAKDVPRDTIAGSIVEFSESSDPVLVLSIKSSADDDVKTMKLVFVQSGMDRSAEIDEWIALLHEEESAKPQKKASSRRPAPEPEEATEPEEAEEMEEAEEEPVPVRPPVKPRQKQELHPAKKPLKDPEKQPPVKRLLSMYKVPEPEPEPEPELEPEPEPEPEFEPEPEVISLPRRPQIRKVPEPAKRQVVTSAYDRESASDREDEVHPVKRPEVQSAMKVAMKGAIRQPLAQPVAQPVRRTVVESPRASQPEPEPEPALVPSRRPVVQESFQERPAHEEPGDNTPQFCHNCGKKLPHSANFCPGCGTKLNQGRTLPHSRTNPSLLNRKATRTDPPGHDHRTVPAQPDEDEIDDEKPIPTRPPVKKAPKGSEMTILHKFLRR